MKYKCLIFDHDDTAVNSTRNVHFPCFLEFVEKYNLNLNFTLEEYVSYNFEPGLVKFYREICGMDDDLMDKEHAYWIDYASKHRATAFHGIKEIMDEHINSGGILTVVSHSHRDNILRDYEYNGFPTPHLILGFEQPREELKPSPIPVFKIMEKYNLKPEEVIVIDDLKPGYTMAKAAGVSFAASAWCFDIEKNKAFMKEHADYYCSTVEELGEALR